MTKPTHAILALSALALAAAALGAAPTAGAAKAGTPKPQTKKETKESKMIKTASGLEYEDTVVGTGESPRTGMTCVMHYTGWLWVDGKKGEKFDSSLDRGKPFKFPIGAGRVIKGWDEGVSTMKVGGKRTLLIPPQLGYGERGAGGVIPPNASLLFEVELLGLEQ